LITNFYFDTEPDGYDALYELEQLCKTGSAKWNIIQDVRNEIEIEADLKDIEF